MAFLKTCVRNEDIAMLIKKPKMVTWALWKPGRTAAAQTKSRPKGTMPAYMKFSKDETRSGSAKAFCIRRSSRVKGRWTGVISNFVCKVSVESHGQGILLQAYMPPRAAQTRHSRRNKSDDKTGPRLRQIRDAHVKAPASYKRLAESEIPIKLIDRAGKGGVKIQRSRVASDIKRAGGNPAAGVRKAGPQTTRID